MSFLVALACISWVLVSCRPKGVPPDIVLISLDAVRADCGAGPWGEGVMPNLARLARGGVRFDQAWAPASNTLSSHATLFTGLPTWQHGFDPSSKTGKVSLTLMPRLRSKGYSTAVFTSMKFWLGPEYGFDVGADVFKTEMADGVTVNRWVRDYLSTDPPHPRALFVHFYDAHSDKWQPYESSFRQKTAFDGCVGELCGSRLLRAVTDGTVSLPEGAAEAIREAYRDSCREVDAHLGALLSLLAPTQEQSFIAVFADHGELLGEDGWLHHGSHPAVLDIPMVMRWPGCPSGVVSEVPVTLRDLSDTVEAVAAVDIEGKADLRTMLSGSPERRVRVDGAIREGRRAACRLGDGRIMCYQRAEDGHWQESPPLERLEQLLSVPPEISVDEAPRH